MKAIRAPERPIAAARPKPARQGEPPGASLDLLFATRRRQTVRGKAQGAAAALRAYVEEGIAAGSLPPGTQLPTEVELMAEFRAGRNTIRKAMQALQAEGKIVRQVGAGTFVAEPRSAGRVPRGGEPGQTARSVARLANPSDVMELRLVFEPGAVAIAALRASLQEIEHMERVIVQSAQAASLQEFETLDCELHRAFGRATKNVIFARVYDIISAARQHTAWGRLKERVLTSDHRRRHTNEHERIVAAIRERDGARARAEMTEHLDAINRIMFGAAGGVGD